MAGDWSFADPEAPSGPRAGLVLVEGDSFCISAENGDVRQGTIGGLFDRDTRFLSQWELLVGDDPLEFLARLPSTPFSGGVLGRSRPVSGRADSTLLVQRHRYVGRGMREDIVLQNWAREPVAVTLTLMVDADFAHLFEVKEQRVVPRGERSVRRAAAGLDFDYSWGDLRRGVRVRISEGELTVLDDCIAIATVVPARAEWRTCAQVTLAMDDGPVIPLYRCGEPLEASEPLRRFWSWQRRVPHVRSGHAGFNELVARAEQDLGALRIFDPEHPERPVVAAGAPWFMTLFGRDSLIASWMSLLVDPSLAEGTLRTLARYQGSKVDPASEEEPGRIPHELRWGLSRSLARGSGSLYYGSIDATPLFVMLLGELRRWGLAEEAVDELLPHVDRALEWMVEFGDRDGDGFIEYKRATDRGLVNQGWKDSWDGISFASGRLPEAPVALCEVQGYAYAAFLARAHFADEAGDSEGTRRWAEAAARLRRAFNEAFWIPGEEYFAVGLDADKTPIDSVTSNVAHCLWTGIVDEAKAQKVAERLMSEEMFTGFGVRTLSSEMGAYNPVSYHNGSVWPHDTALAAAGLMRYGFGDASQRVMMGLIEAAGSFGGRLPELFSGFARAQFPVPVPYPTACAPQAWAAAAAFTLVRTMLRLDPWVPRSALWLAPLVPDELGELVVTNVPMGPARLEFTVKGEDARVEGTWPNLLVHEAARPPLHKEFLVAEEDG